MVFSELYLDPGFALVMAGSFQPCLCVSCCVGEPEG